VEFEVDVNGLKIHKGLESSTLKDKDRRGCWTPGGQRGGTTYEGGVKKLGQGGQGNETQENIKHHAKKKGKNGFFVPKRQGSSGAGARLSEEPNSWQTPDPISAQKTVILESKGLSTHKT